MQPRTIIHIEHNKIWKEFFIPNTMYIYGDTCIFPQPDGNNHIYPSDNQIITLRGVGNLPKSINDLMIVRIITRDRLQ